MTNHKYDGQSFDIAKPLEDNVSTDKLTATQLDGLTAASDYLNEAVSRLDSGVKDDGSRAKAEVFALRFKLIRPQN